MRVSFRHGIVRYQQPNFLTVTGTTVDLLASSTSPFVATIAYGDKDFLHVEIADIPNAWVGVVPSVDQWLYIDIDIRTGTRTFGITSPIPIIGPNEPINPAQDQHWFDTNLNIMKVWDTTLWFPKIRLIVCRLEAGLLPQSVSDNLVTFAGTQINDYTDVDSGLILYDSLTNLPIKDANGRFITSEDKLFTFDTPASQLKVDTIILQGVASTNIPKYSIVKFMDYGVLVPADSYSATSDIVFGIIEQDVIQGEAVDVTTGGIVRSNDWDWSTHPVNTPLYINNTGLLQTTPDHENQPPVAIIVDPQAIMLGAPQHTTNVYSNPPMSTTEAGVAKISVLAVNPADPIVVGDNDPRMTDARVPRPHSHQLTDTTGLQGVLDLKVNLSGGTMTGPLILNANPSVPYGATTKQYVDTRRISDLYGVVASSPAQNDILKFDGTNWINTPVPSSNVVLQGDVTGTGTTNVPITTALTNVVAPGTASKVTYDGKGRIIGSSLLVDTDIPSLDWSKITTGTPITLAGYGITDAYTKAETNILTWDWHLITGTPTLLAGYGITDAYTKAQVDNHSWSWSTITNTPSTLVGYGIGDAVANASGTPSIFQDAYANRPTGTTGQLFVDTTNNRIQRHNGSTWVDLSGYPITLTGDVSGTGTSTINVTLNTTIPISKGGTGSTNAVSAINSLLPSQSTNFGKVLVTDGTNVSWTSFPTPPVLSVNTQTGNVNVTTISGNAGSASILQTARNIVISGDITGTTSFDGSSDANINATLSSVNPTTIGSFGTSTQVGTFTVDNKGRITNASNTTITPAWTSLTGVPNTIAGYGITDATPLSHMYDMTAHVTAEQNTWIDAITATSAEVNYLVGVTDGIQAQLNDKVSKSGSTMGNAASLVFAAGGEVLGLPATPSSATSAVSKAYVDSIATAGTTWHNPIRDPSLIDIVISVPGTPTNRGTYIKYGGPQGETWGTLTNVVDGDILTYTNSDWIRIGTLSVGSRFFVAGRAGTVGPTLAVAGFVDDDIIEYVSGDPTLFTSWSLPDGRGQGGAGTEINQGVTVLVNNPDSIHLGHTYLYDAVGNQWIEIAGPGSIGAGNGLSYSGSTLNVNLGAGITLQPADEVGIDYHLSGGLFTTTDGTTPDTTTNARLAIKLDGTTLSLSSGGLTLSAGVVSPNTYKSVTVDTYGRVTSGSNPTTLVGYGIIDAQPLDSDLTAIAALTGTTGLLHTNGAGVWSVDTTAYLTSNQLITLSGDVTGSGTTSINVTLNTVPISKGGTGQTTANAALNALLPTQSGHIGQVLTTDGTNTSWTTAAGGGSGSPGGTDTQVQYNSSGTFAGATGLTTDGTNLGLSGNLTFGGAGRRLFGDFSDATRSNRVLLQTTITNGITEIPIIPNGTATTAGIFATNSSDIANTAYLQLSSTSTDSRVTSGTIGTGVAVPLVFYTGGAERLKIDTSGNISIGTPTATNKLTINLNASTSVVTPPGIDLTKEGCLHLVPDDTFGARLTMDGFGNPPNISVRRANGTMASPTALVANDTIAAFSLFGRGTTSYSSTNRGQFLGYAAENWTDAAQGTRWTITTVPIGSTTAQVQMTWEANGNIVIGSGALATSATDGFLHLPSVPGIPTGVPTSYTGRVPITIDTADNRLYFYNSGWQQVTGGGGGGTPGGIDTQIQYNSSGSFAGATGLTTDGTNLTLAGNATFTAAGAKIIGDFSNATASSRLYFQTSTLNGNTLVTAFPNGSGNSSSWVAYATTAISTSPYVQIQASNTESVIQSGAGGSGTPQPISFKVNGTTRVQIPYGSLNAVNYLTLQGSTTTNPVVVGAAGTDTNVSIRIAPKGTGNVQIATGDLTFNSTGQRITGDFNNATIASRLAFQTSTPNAVTAVGVLPNGTATQTAISVYNASDPTNGSRTTISTTASESRLVAAADGSGTNLPLHIYTNGATQIQVPASAGSVNYLTLQGSTTTNPVTIGANGTDTNISIKLSPKGTGDIQQTTTSVSQSNGDFSAPFDAVSRQYILRTVTTTASLTEMFLDGSSTRMTLPNDTTWQFQVQVVARRTDVDNESAAYTFNGCIDRNTTAASTAIVGGVMKTIVAEDTTAWDVNVNADTTNGALRIQVTGEAAKTIRWVAFVRTVEVTG